MNFYHTICYPDTDQIFLGKESMNKTQAFNLFQTFEWSKELSKRIEHYSPTIEFIRISDNSAISISGIGERKLSRFQIMLDGGSCQEFSIEKTTNILKEYLRRKDINSYFKTRKPRVSHQRYFLIYVISYFRVKKLC